MIAAATWLLGALSALAGDAAARPNVVFVLIDDLRFDEIDYPFVELPNIERLAREGVRFRNAFVTTPLCSPSRASFLTGQYAHTHGITDNTDRSPRSHELVTFPRLLHDAGYETAFVGKWHMGIDDSARPGFDHWVSVKGQGRYLDPEFNVNGERRVVPGYVTDILNGFALRLPGAAAREAVPALPRAQGRAPRPDAERRRQRLRPERGHLRPGRAAPGALRRRDRSPAARTTGSRLRASPRSSADFPTCRRSARPPGRATRRSAIGSACSRRSTRASAGCSRPWRRAASSTNTLVVFTSDHGYFYGEHGLSVERRLAYEESARIPLLMRLPPLVPAGRSIDELVLNIDLAPTLLELGGAPRAQGMHGRSLVPLLRGERAAMARLVPDRVLLRHASSPGSRTWATRRCGPDAGSTSTTSTSPGWTSSTTSTPTRTSS